MLEHNLWVEKYRPRTIDECILTAKARKTFNSFLKKKELPHLLLAGRSGIGKTTAAKALCAQLGCDYILINSSDEGGIDVLRTKIKDFASTVSFVEDDIKKYIILDEAERLSPATQEALRGFMEQYAANAGFILTCNVKGRIIDALHSRLTEVDMAVGKADKANILEQALARMETILKAENVEYDREVVAKIVVDKFPDWRRAINRLKALADCGPILKIDDNDHDEFSELVKALKGRDFMKMRRWVAETHMLADEVFRKFYDNCVAIFTPETLASLIILLGEYQYKAAHVADEEINLMAFLTQVMMECKLK